MCENLAVHGDLLDAYYSSELFKVDATLMRMSGVSGSGEVEHRTRRGYPGVPREPGAGYPGVGYPGVGYLKVRGGIGGHRNPSC